MGPGVQEATPLVYKGVMYLPNPSDYIQAIDAATAAGLRNVLLDGQPTSRQTQAATRKPQVEAC